MAVRFPVCYCVHFLYLPALTLTGIQTTVFPAELRCRVLPLCDFVAECVSLLPSKPLFFFSVLSYSLGLCSSRTHCAATNEVEQSFSPVFSSPTAPCNSSMTGLLEKDFPVFLVCSGADD